MHRRQLLSGMLAWAFSTCFSPHLVLRAATRRSPATRVRPSDSTWPSQASWDALKRDVGGNLIEVSPPFGVCASDPSSPACGDALRNLQNPFYLGDQAGGTQVSGWVTAWQPAPSRYAVAARTAADVAAAINFARENNVRLVVKGGGHSYQGTSNAPDSLLIWTRRMKAITLHDDFVPKGCEHRLEPQAAVSIESGAMWIDAYDAVTTQAGRYVQGGGCTTVGVAGLIQSGGFGTFSKGFGMAAAGLLEAEIVTSDGLVRTVNACRDADLFWALKGGGGGSWGVVTKVTLRTQPLPEFFGGAEGSVKASSDAAYRQLIRQFVDFYGDRLFNPHWGEQIHLGPDNTLRISMNCQGLSDAQAAEVWRPFFEQIRANSQLLVTDELYAGARPAHHWWDAVYRKSRGSTSMIGDPRDSAPQTHAWWSGDKEQVGALLYAFESAWLPAGLLQRSKRPSLADSLFESSRHHSVELHFNKGLAGAPADAVAAAGDTATNPAALNAFALAIIAGGGRPGYPGLPGSSADLTAARIETENVARAMSELRKVAPGAGSYVSESNFFERDWRHAYWGTHYNRLRAAKDKYDPEGLFIVHHGVGSEDWTADGFTRLVGR